MTLFFMRNCKPDGNTIIQAVVSIRYLVKLVLAKTINVCVWLIRCRIRRAAGTAWDAEGLRGNVANENRIMVPVHHWARKWQST